MDSTAMADRHEVSGLLYGEIFDAVALFHQLLLHRRRCEESCTARLRRVVRLAEGLLLAAGAEDPCNLTGGEGPGTSGKRMWCGGNAANGYPLKSLGGGSYI